MKLKYLVLHHTSSYSTGASQLQAVNEYHQVKNWGTTKHPWYQPKPSSLGYYVVYTYFMDARGKITQTRARGEEQLAQKGYNTGSESMCLQGDFNAQMPTQAQIDSLRAFIIEEVKQYGVVLKLHKELQKNRTCPGYFCSRKFLETVVLKTKVQTSDKVDKEKAKKIAELMKQLEEAKSLLAKLLDKIKLWKK